jgi:arylsulfatase A-like enzyme
MRRRQLLRNSAGVLTALVLGAPGFTITPPRRPNFIIVLCDDLGFGDVGAMGGKTIHTPNIDRMAREGTVLTDYYAPANICTPSRAGLLTGRYPIRTGLAWQVIMPTDRRGLPLSEVTIPEALKPAGYVSALIGKWHLGHVAPYWPPTRHGFDLFFGLPYSHDMQPLLLYTDNGPGVELTHEDVTFTELQQRFYARAEKFIDDHAGKPFFLELALSAPHLPNDPNPRYRDRSAAGAYGDVVEEVDAIIGRLNAHLKSLGIERDTLVILTSDNGPWYEGSSGGLRDRKGGAGYDGGYRVPFIARMPGTVPAGKRVASIAMGIDFLPTLCALAGLPNPPGVELDGRDISAVLTRGAPSPHEELILFDNEDVVAVRTQRWKYVASTYYRGNLVSIAGRKTGLTDSPQLYDMARDNSENYSAAARNPTVVADLQARLARARETFDSFRTQRSQAPVAGAMPPMPAEARRQD